jgi:hypothetical protein
MAGITDYESMRKLRRVIIGIVLLALGVGLGYTWPRSSAWPAAETGTVLSVNVAAHGAPITFVFRPTTGKEQQFVLASPTPWQPAPAAKWYASGRPSCITPGSSVPARATIGVIGVRSTSGAPAESVVVWIQCR